MAGADGTDGEADRDLSPRVVTVVLMALVVVVAGLVAIAPWSPTLGFDPGSLGLPDPVADADGRLPVPEVGAVLPAYLDDLTPVFVVRPEPGTVLVLDAVDPHDPWGLDKLVTYCSPSDWFEDLYHGSRFNGSGDWMGGPAPSGLATFGHEYPADDGGLLVSGMRLAGTAREAPRAPGDDQPTGPSCGDTSEIGVGAEFPPILVHRPPRQVPTVDPAAPERSLHTERWTWAAMTVVADGAALRVCAADGACPDDAPEVVAGPIDLSTWTVPRAERIHLARLTDDGRIRLLQPADASDGGVMGLIRERS
jgi:hypothetical protein